MTDTRKDLPPTGSANFLEKVREALSTYLGGRGDRLDRGLTVRDLYETGIIDLREGFLKGGGGYSPVKGIGASVAPAVVVKDLTPPPTPTGFVASAGISQIFIGHDAPTYTPGHGHNRTIVYGLTYTTGALPVFANAVKITEFAGSVFAHPSQPATEWHLWIKWLSNDGVLSLIPAGGTNGLTVTTGQDVSTLLTALNGQLTTSQLNTALGARINLIDGSDSLAGSVNTRLAAEALARVNAVTAEALSRSNAVTAETDARVNAVTLESIQRRKQVTANAESLLYNTLASNNVRLDASAATTVAKSELTNQFTTGILAEATSRLTLAAKLDTEKATTLGLITDESAARSTSVSAEATTRSLLATQFRGTYDGNDLTLLTEGLLYQERTTRTTQDNALSQQITLLSAGAGEQFDWQTIWYFDNGSENWTGNGAPTAAAGFLRPANQATAAYVESPSGIATDAAKYTQTRMRVRKTGAPVWAAYLYWQATTDSTWGTTRRVALTQPTWDANGIGLVTITAPWAGTINKIRVDLSAAQTGTDYYELDWVAVGRPSPGASSAQLLIEQTARVNADGVLTSNVATLSAQVNNSTNGLPATYAGLVSEQTARANADTAEAALRTTLAARVTTNEGSITTNASAISAEQTTRATADSTNASNTTALSSQVNDAATGLPKTRADLIVAQNTFASGTTSFATDVRTLKSQSAQMSEAALKTILNGEAANAANKNSLALASQELRTNIVDGLSAEAAARLALLAAVNANAATLTSEQLTRASSDDAESAARVVLTARVTTNEGAITTNAATIAAESTTRATADTAISSRVDAVVATAGANTAAISSEATTRASADGTLFAQYTVKVDVNGYVSGFGLASTANNAGPSSAFAVRADQFYIASPSGPGVAAQLPFIVRTTATTINGVSVPVGVYMQDAFIQNGTITNAKIGNAQIDDAKIANLSASKITAGSIAVGSYIASTNYVAGSAGWTINGSGYAEFSNVVVRGGVYATTGQIGGNAINSTGLQSPGYSAGTSGWRLDSSGNLYAKSGTFGGSLAAASGTFAGSLQAATGTFSGNLSAAGGSFSGQLTANAINAVDTINIAGNAVTVAASASGSSLSTYLSMYLTAGQTVFVTCLVDGAASPRDVNGTCVYRFYYGERLGYLYLNGGLVRSVVSVNPITSSTNVNDPGSISGVSQFTLLYVFTPTYTGYHSLEVRTTQATYWYYTDGNVNYELSTPASIFALQAKR